MRNNRKHKTEYIASAILGLVAIIINIILLIYFYPLVPSTESKVQQQPEPEVVQESTEKIMHIAPLFTEKKTT